MPKQTKKDAAKAAVRDMVISPDRAFTPEAPFDFQRAYASERAVAEESAQDAPSFSEGVGAALRLETIIDAATKRYVESTFDPEDNFAWTDETWKEATAGLPVEHHKHLLRARSRAHGIFIRSNIEREMEDARTLERMGTGSNIGLRLGAAILDPAQALLALATGPISASSKATRLANVFRSGLAAGGTNAAIEGFLTSQQATRDGTDVLEAGLIGFLLGAPLGALSPAENAAMRSAAHKGITQTHLGRVEEAGGGLTLTDAGKAVMADARGAPAGMADFWLRQIERNKADAASRVEREGLSWAEHVRTGMRSAAAQEDFLARIRALPGDTPLDEQASFLWHQTFGRREARGPSAMELAFARDAARRAVRAEEAAKIAHIEATAAGKDAAYAAQEAQRAREVELAYAQREQQIADEGGKGLTEPNIRLAKAPAEDLGRTFEKGDTAWFDKDGRLVSGKVEKIADNGKVMVRDDQSGDLVGFHPERDDPTGEYSGLVSKGTPEGGFGRGSIGAGQIADVDVPETAMSAIKIGRFEIPLRWDYFSIFMRQSNVALKRLALALVADPVGFADKTLARGMNATEAAEMVRLRYEKRFLAQFEDGFADLVKRQRVPFLQMGKARNKFAEDITRIVRGDDTLAREIPEAAKVVAEMRAVHADLLGMAQKYGVEGAELVDPDPFYMMRKFNHNRIRMIAGKYDDASVESMIQQAILAVRTMDPQAAARIAKGYWQTVRRLQYTDSMHDLAFGPKEFARLRAAMQEQGVDSDIIDDVADAVAGRSGKQTGDHARLKHRTVMDELYSADVLTKDGTVERLSISDLFVNDSRMLMRGYTRQMSGLVGFARVGIRSEADWNKRIKEVIDEAERTGADPEQLKKHLRYIEDIRKFTLGRPMADQSFGTLDRVLRVLRDVNFIRNMGQAGFAQVPEIGNLMGLAGMRAFTMHVPSLKDIFTHARAGRLDDDLARDLLNMGLGGEHLAITPNLREIDEWAYDRQLSKIEHLTEKGKYITANVGGLAAMNDALHTAASKMFVQKLSDYAQGLSKLGKKDLARLNWAGIGEDNIDGIFAALKKHTQLGENGRVLGINWEDWQRTNPQTFDEFNLAVFRESRKAIQQPTIGETSPWMHTQIGKVLTQFRSFTLVAWAKQGMHNLHYADASTAVAWSMSMVFAGLAYAAQNSINFAHNAEEREKRLAPDEIAKAAFQRAGFASLAPAAWDTLMMFTQGEPTFAYGRTTGLGTGLIVGNPTMDLLSSKGLGTLQNVTRSIFDDEHMWTRKDVKSGLGLFLPNYLGVRNFVDAASNEFPARNFLEQRETR